MTLIKRIDWMKPLQYILQGMIIAIILIAILLAYGSYLRARQEIPPITLTSLQPEHLGELCPGAFIPIINRVIIERPVEVVYRVSTMDERAVSNFIGTQTAWLPFAHPHPGTFENEFPWTVPNFQPGTYARVFWARGTDGDELSVFVINRFSIAKGEKCDEQIQSSWNRLGNPPHRVSSIDP